MTIGKSFRLLEHTSDMGVEARAGSCVGVLEEIARGLATMSYGDSSAAAVVEAEIVVHAEDLVELLVSWLNEVVYWSEKENLVPADFRIESLSNGDLIATVAGEPFDPVRHTVERQVKSVTYHQACLQETSEGWYARVYVDL